MIVLVGAGDAVMVNDAFWPSTIGLVSLVMVNCGCVAGSSSSLTVTVASPAVLLMV